MTKNRWVFTEPGPIPEDFKSGIGGHPLVAQTLFQRGFQDLQTAQAFLDPADYLPTPANQLPDLEVACQLLSDAIRQHQRIFVWGDFDVDGQTATTILVEGLRHLGGRVMYHVPVRGEESHGINRMVLERYLIQGFDLFLTCDTGITEIENVKFLCDSGIPVIITDHHTLGEVLPPANAIVNPQRLSTGHPLRALPGVGVAYKLIEGLYDFVGESFEANPFLELAALGITADLAELQRDTRYLLQKGLASLRKTERIGLKLLFQHAGLNPYHINEEHIAFQVAPRLNAVGRLGDANSIIEFFTTTDQGRARVLASQIEALNAKRRFATRQVEQGAESLLASSLEDRHAPAIVLHHPDWPGGVVGIVASRLVERYQKPVLLLTGKDPLHGSARSIPGIHITEVIATQSKYLKSYGGHPMAAGLSLSERNLPAFKQGIWSEFEKCISRVDAVSELEISQTLTPEDVSIELVDEISRLSPFGPSNPPLHFLMREMNVTSSAAIGQFGEHRQVSAQDENGSPLRLIWWNGGDQSLPEGKLDLVCKLSKTDYRGSPEVSVEWVDYQLSEIEPRISTQKQRIVHDQRQLAAPITWLQVTNEENPDLTIWAEGDLKLPFQSLARHQLTQKTKILVIWTAPPSHRSLSEILMQTDPEEIIVIGIDTRLDAYQPFMERLAGLVKFAVKNKQGKASLVELASACAAEENTILIGLQLWEAMGKIKFTQDDQIFTIDLVHTNPEPSLINIYQPLLNSLLDETRAFRRYFKKGSIEKFLYT